MARTRSSEEGCRMRWRKSWKDVDVDLSITSIRIEFELNVVKKKKKKNKNKRQSVVTMRPMNVMLWHNT